MENETMETPMPLPDAVQWSAGLLLSPQHLQQNDIYWQSQLRHRLSCVTPHYWGLLKLAIDASALVKGSVAVTELECVLPDGLAVQFPAAYPARTLEADVAERAGSDGRPVRVWLQLSERNATAAKCDNAERRYDSLPGDITPDENTGDGDVRVGRLRPCLRLHVDDAAKLPPDGRSACPLFDVARDAQGRLHVTNYHPPLLRQDASAFLKERGLQHCLSGLVQRMWAKLEELAGHRSDDAEPGVPPSPHMLAARRIADALPQMEICAHAPAAHPEDLYRALAELVGRIAGIGDDPIPPKMKPYAHADCMPQFRAAIEYVDAKLAQLNGAYECLPFVPLDIPKIGSFRFVRRLPADASDNVLIELRPHTGQTNEQLSEWLDQADIVSDRQFHAAQKARVRGARAVGLSQKDIGERKLAPQGPVFKLMNGKVPIEGADAQAAFRGGQLLLIHGPHHGRPKAILLHHRKQPRTSTVAVSATPNEPDDHG